MARPDLRADLAAMVVEVFFSPAPRQVRHWTLVLPAGSLVAQAIAAARAFPEFPELPANELRMGVWGRRAGLSQVLANNDRLEIYRPLRVDPKVARRQRFDRQGARTAGLFIAKRPGSKAGY